MMIEHIVLFKFEPTTTEAKKRELISRLKGLAGRLEGILRLEIHRDVLRLEDSFDLGLFITFADRASLERYGEDEERRAASAWARSLCQQVILFDYRRDSA